MGTCLKKKVLYEVFSIKIIRPNCSCLDFNSISVLINYFIVHLHSWNNNLTIKHGERLLGITYPKSMEILSLPT